MQLTGYKHTKNQVSFGSYRFFPIVVKDMNNRHVKAWFSQLNFSDPVDAAAMKKVKELWVKHYINKNEISFINYPYYDLKEYIYKEFETRKSVFAIELDSDKNLFDKLLCLASAHKEKDTFKLDYIMASPNSFFGTGEKKEYKGVGTALMCGLVKIAKLGGAKSFELYPVVDDFYTRLGMEKINDYMTFNRIEMIAFLERQKSKFNAFSKK
ncbi:MAG: hypothetical protein WCG23_03525 [bacterium]